MEGRFKENIKAIRSQKSANCILIHWQLNKRLVFCWRYQ